MKARYVVTLVLFSVITSSCTHENKKEVIVKTSQSSATVEKSKTKGKCCVSSIPARFSIKNSNIPQPSREN